MLFCAILKKEDGESVFFFSETDSFPVFWIQDSHTGTELLSGAELCAGAVSPEEGERNLADFYGKIPSGNESGGRESSVYQKRKWKGAEGE